MNGKIGIIIVALLALAAVEFVAIGADAAGLGRGDGSAPPPAARRQRTPAAVATPTITGCVPGDAAACGPAGIHIAADPLVIKCDGNQTSRVTVRLFDATGTPVADGTFVSAYAYNGDTAPLSTSTQGGAAEFSVRFYSDIFPPGPNVIVDSGAFEAGIRVRCVPNSQCPLSPPTSVSPPCATPTPYPCIPSPGSGPMSPPCATPPAPPVCEHPGNQPQSPPCVPLSPPSCPDRSGPPCGGPPSPPRCRSATNPRCAAPTPVPTVPPSPPPCNGAISPPCRAPRMAVLIDCDLSAEGVQSDCNLPAGAQTLDVGVVLSNRSGVSSTIGAFNFYMHDSDTSLLSPPSGLDNNLDSNPDFNQARLGGNWDCRFPPPSADTGADGAGKAVSLLSCFIDVTGPLPTIADREDVRLATVHYVVPQAASSGDVLLDLSFVGVYDAPEFREIASCELGVPPGEQPTPCPTAVVSIAAP